MRPASRPLTTTLAALAVFAAAPTHARAHFKLIQPPAYSVQDFIGGPQKSPPCGQADPGQPFEPTGIVTTYVEGEAITIEINEVIYHPGHYRVLIAEDEAAFPPNPEVTPTETPCGFTTIDDDPQIPVLADGLLVHDEPIFGSQTMTVQLPPGFTCDRCLLQVVQFMSDHALNDPGGCYYHHCAEVSVVPATAAPDADDAADAGGPPDTPPSAEVAGSPDSGSAAPPDAPDPTADTGSDGGCAGGEGGAGAFLLFALACVVATRPRLAERLGA